jgi:CMP-N,N'-diacetyllegionaminic acid synthase
VKTPRVICIIGARSGSKSIKDKNLLCLNGKTLLQIAVEKALKSRLFSKVVVSSDSERYLTIAENFGATTVLRPLQFASDGSSEYEYVRHALDYLKCYDEFDFVVRIQVTSPFQQMSSVRAALAILFDNPGLDSVQIVAKTSTNCHKALVLDDNQLLKPLCEGAELGPSNRQHYRETYVRANVWCTRIQSIRKGSLVGDRSGAFVIKGFEGLDLDDSFDWEIIQAVLKAYPDLIGKV